MEHVAPVLAKARRAEPDEELTVRLALKDVVFSVASCPLCLERLGPQPGTAACPSCATAQHATCVAEFGRCASLGCEGLTRPPVRPLPRPEVPEPLEPWWAVPLSRLLGRSCGRLVRRFGAPGALLVLGLILATAVFVIASQS